jgi:fructose-specific phosphotransferase system IIA component
MDIGDLINFNLVKPSLKGENKYQVIEELLDLLIQNGDITDREKALNDLIEREQYLSTGIENGLAVPHAKSDAAEKLMVCMGISRNGLEFGSVDGQPAQVIFLVLSPREISGPHIKILAQISRNFREGEIGNQLKDAKDKDEIIKILKKFK